MGSTQPAWGGLPGRPYHVSIYVAVYRNLESSRPGAGCLGQPQQLSIHVHTAKGKSNQLAWSGCLGQASHVFINTIVYQLIGGNQQSAWGGLPMHPHHISIHVGTYIVYSWKASSLLWAACLKQPYHVSLYMHIYIEIGKASNGPGAGCLGQAIISLYM